VNTGIIIGMGIAIIGAFFVLQDLGYQTNTDPNAPDPNSNQDKFNSPAFAEASIELLVSPIVGRTLDPHLEASEQRENFIVRDIENSLLWHTAYPEIEGLDYVEGNTYLISAKKSPTIPLVESPKYELIELKQVFKSHKPYENTCAPGYHIWRGGDCVFGFRCGEYAYPGKLCVINSQTQDYLRPLQQEKTGVLPEDVICLESFQLLFGFYNNSVCVDPSSVDKLLERGYTLGKNNNDSPYS
jgi:hypothetical protein